MSKNNCSHPMTEEEKQKRPMPGETSVKDAYLKARQFAALEKAGLKKTK